MLPWISRSLEGLWLLAVFLVPLTFLDQEYAISEAQIAYVEVPKVALLRTLAGLIAILWALEWAVKSNALNAQRDPFPVFLLSTSKDLFTGKLSPSNLVPAISTWLRVHPTRWFLLAAGLFFGSTFLTTVLSGSFNNSMWGEIPGQDGYSAYTVASYGVLFGVIATHLKSPAQLGRLLGAVVLMGVLVSLYGIFQHYGHDFLNLTESTGGGSERVTIFMGNAIFAAAVLSMTVPLTLVAASINFRDETWGNWGPLSKLDQLARDSVSTLLWASVLAVQLLGLMFTFSRGPWSGAVMALAVFLGLIVISLGWRMLIRAGLVLGLAGVLSIAFLHWQGNVSVVNVGPWLGFALALLGLIGTIGVLFVISKSSRAIVFIAAVGAAVVVVGAVVLAPSAWSGRGDPETAGVASGDDSTAGQVGQRISSIKTDVLGGFVGGRATHWKVSWTLIKDRPWFEFDDLSLTWLRPVIGYGPDLFRYTYLLESPPDAFRFLPLEPDHAHNFFIHQTVEQGILGGLASVALFVSVLAVAGHHLLRRRRSGNSLYRLLLLGLVAVILGRLLEMMVGVARISDLTVLWTSFALFGALLSFDTQDQIEEPSLESQPARPSSRRSRRAAARTAPVGSLGIGLLIRLAIVAWLAGGVGVVTWQKSINSVRASVAEGRALEHFRTGDLESTVKELDNAIALAPWVPNYYNNRAEVFLAYQIRPGLFTEPSCNQQTEVPYLFCLGRESLNSNLESIERQPFNYRARLAAGNSAFNLNLNEPAIGLYTNAVGMVPSAFRIRNDLAESQLDVGSYDRALAQLTSSLSITGDSEESSRALHLQGRAYQELGRLDEALEALKQGLFLNPGTGTAQASLDRIDDIMTEQGIRQDIDHFNEIIDQNPNDSVAVYYRGLIHLAQGNPERAVTDLEQSLRLGLDISEIRANLGYSQLKAGVDPNNITDLDVAIGQDPDSALINVYYGEFQRLQENYVNALSHLENANKGDPNLALAHLIRAKVFKTLGLNRSAKEVLDISISLDLPTGQDYVDRGEMHAFFGDSDLAFMDMEEAFLINPNNAEFYNARGKVFASEGDFVSALADFNSARELDLTNTEYLISLGVVHNILGNTESSLADVDVPPPEERTASYFAVFGGATSGETESKQSLRLRIEAAALRNIEIYEGATSQVAVQSTGQAYLDLGLWNEAARNFSAILDQSPGNTEALRGRGDAFLALKRYEEALRDYSQAIFVDAINADNFSARGTGYAEAGEFELADSDFGAAIAIHPGSSEAYAMRGYLSVQSGDYAMAFPDIDRAIEISPLNHDAYFKRSDAYTAIDETSMALEDLARAINLAPTNTDYLLNRGLLHLQLGAEEPAIEDFNEAIALRESFIQVDPKRARPFIGRGRAYLQSGNPDQALNDAVRAIQLLEGNLDMPEWDSYRTGIILKLADAHELLGDAYTGLGNDDEAQAEYQIVSKLR